MSVNLIDNITVVGAGIMGIGIAQNFAQAGLIVKLVDINQKVLEAALSQIETNLQLFEEYHLLTEERTRIFARIIPFSTQSLDKAMQNCYYAVEAIPENPDAKKNIFAQLEKSSLQAIIASNTSSFTISELAGGMKRPERLVGVHYFNPAHIIPVVEIHQGEKTSDETIDITRSLMLKAGKKPVMVKKILPGFIVNRLTGALEREILHLLAEGVASAEDLDTAVKGSIGFRLSCLGQQETEDMVGLDTSLVVSNRLFKVLSNAIEATAQLAAKVQAGELGVKSGKGWYDYSGKTRQQVLDENNRKLLRQLAVYQGKDVD
jgi:3-hydroxybutyryl-CoA dehydrogenase